MLQSFIFDIVWNKNELRSASRMAELPPRHHIFLIKYNKPLQVVRKAFARITTGVHVLLGLKNLPRKKKLYEFPLICSSTKNDI